MQYAMDALRQYPKAERFVLAAETRASMYKIIELIIVANKKYTKKTTLQNLDIELDVLRVKVRLGMKAGCLPFRKYEILSKKLDEVGRLLGGWIRSENHRQIIG